MPKKQLVACIGFEILTFVTVRTTVFWVVMPCRLERSRSFVEKYCLHLQGQRLFQSRNQGCFSRILVYFSTLKIEAVCLSEMSVCLRTTQCYYPEDYVTCIYAVF
jgi:hypothetical protein